MLEELTRLSTWVDIATVIGVVGALYVVRRDGKRIRTEDRVRRGDQARTVTLEFNDGLEEAVAVGLDTKRLTFVVGTITNHSERPLLDVRFELPRNPHIRLTSLPHVDNLAFRKVVRGDGQTFSACYEVEGPFDWAEFLNVHVRFTDANGARWRRTEYAPPQEILESPKTWRTRMQSLRRAGRRLYAGTIDDFYDAAIGAYELKEFNVRAFRLGLVVAYWNGDFYLRPAAMTGGADWTRVRSAANLAIELERLESGAPKAPDDRELNRVPRTSTMTKTSSRSCHERRFTIKNRRQGRGASCLLAA